MTQIFIRMPRYLKLQTLAIATIIMFVSNLPFAAPPSLPTGKPTFHLLINLTDMYTDEESRNLFDCDRKLKPIKLQIVNQLGRRYHQIQNYYNSSVHDAESKSNASATTPPLESDQAAPLVKIVEASPVSTVKGSYTLATGWPAAIALYEQIKSEKSIDDWVELYEDVLFLMSNEESRIINHENFSLYPTDLPTLLDLYTEVEKCASAKCRYLPLDKFAEWMEDRHHYRAFIQDMKSPKTNAEQTAYQEDMRLLRKRLRKDISKFTPKAHPMISVSKDGTLLVPIASAYGSSQNKELETHMTQPWIKSGLKVKIVWLGQGAKNAFQLTITRQGSRAEVEMEDPYQVKIPSEVSSRTIAHEFGHILGLRDEYFSIFRSRTCEYLDYGTHDSLMSFGGRDKILTRHTQLIRELYGLTKPSNETARILSFWKIP
jgi:hypothetical protein